MISAAEQHKEAIRVARELVELIARSQALVTRLAMVSPKRANVFDVQGPLEVAARVAQRYLDSLLAWKPAVAVVLP